MRSRPGPAWTREGPRFSRHSRERVLGRMMRVNRIEKSRLLCSVLVGTALALSLPIPVQGQSGVGIAITAPANGSAVVPGQVVQVTVDPIGGFVISSVLLTTPTGLEDLTAPPFTFSVTVPDEAAGEIVFRALGKDPLGTFATDKSKAAVRDCSE